MIEKRILVADRVRQPPRSGFSWIDRRFLQEFAPRLSHDAIVLYFFLAAVSDKHGLSFYRDASIGVRLRVREQAVVAARDELITHDLVAFHDPLTQVLSLPRQGRTERRGQHGLQAVGELFKPQGNQTPYFSPNQGKLKETQGNQTPYFSALRFGDSSAPRTTCGTTS